MNTELENKLFTDFPDLFENRYKSINESCMAFGIECGDGWYDIIRSICYLSKNREANIKSRLKYENKNPDDPSVKFDQIKEKFGGLRIYYSGGDDYIHGAISMAEEMSYKICEVCGNKGYPNKNGWIRTLCDTHKES
jgi:hypothetical protein